IRDIIARIPSEIHATCATQVTLCYTAGHDHCTSSNVLSTKTSNMVVQQVMYDLCHWEHTVSRTPTLCTAYLSPYGAGSLIILPGTIGSCIDLSPQQVRWMTEEIPDHSLLFSSDILIPLGINTNTEEEGNQQQTKWNLHRLQSLISSCFHILN